MNKDTKVLLMAVVIILVALVSFNLSDLTGMVGRSELTTMTISPTIITFGKYDTARMITIRVSPGKSGVNQEMIMYRKQWNTQVGGETANICTSSICYEDVTISYRVDSGLPIGKYYFKAERENTGEVSVSNDFEIRHEY